MDKYLLLRPLSEQELLNLQEKNESQIFVMTEFFTNKFALPHTPIYSSIQSTIYSGALKVVTALPHLNYDGTSILESSKHKGISLFYYTRFILFNRFVLAYRELQAYNHFKTHLKENDTVTVYGVSPYLGKAINNERAQIRLKGSDVAQLSLFKIALLFLFRTLVGIFYLPRLKKARHLFIIPPVEKQPILNKISLEPELGNPITDYFTDELFKRKDGYALEEYYPAKFIKSNLSKKNIFGVFPGKAIFLEPFMAIAFLKSKLNKKPLKNLRLNELKAYNALLEKEDNESFRLANIINMDLFKMRKFAIIRMAAAELFFKNSQIKSIGGIDEYSVRTKSVLDIAQLSGSRTYSFQHGVIHQNHAGYNYLAADAGQTILVNDLFIYGLSTTQMLNYHNYPGNVVISGQIRTDIIPLLKSKSDTISIKGLRPGKPMVLWATQPDLPGDEPTVRDSISLDFFELTKEYPEVDFVIKLHPRENEINYYHKLAKSVGATNFIFSNSDLFLLLSKCAVLLTHCSAVGAEAVYFEKPLIVQDYKNVDVLEYIKTGVGIKASNYVELKTEVSNVLSGTKKIDSDAYQRYQEHFNGNEDGRAVERILNTIIA